jgi:hypothetical protein
MGSPVPSLTQLAANVAATNNLNLEAINPMPAELVDYVYALRRNIPLNLASEFAVEYIDLNTTFAALGIENLQLDVIIQFLPRYEALEQKHARALEVILKGLEAAYQITDQQWFDYLVPVLTMAQQQMEQLGETLGVVLNVLRNHAQTAAG